MPWVRLDDQFFINPKSRAAGVDGRALFLASLCWCSMQLNDGTFLASDVQAVAVLAGVPDETAGHLLPDLWHPSGHDCPKCRAAGQTMPVPGGHIAIHGYLEANPSREQVIARKEQAVKAAEARHGRRPAGSSANGNADSSAKALPIPSHPPVDKTLLSSSGNSRGTSPPVDNPDDDGFFAAVWDQYAQLMYAKQPTGSVEKPHPWKLKTADNAKTEHHDTATRWHADYDVTPNQLAACLVDGKPPAAHYRRKDQP